MSDDSKKVQLVVEPEGSSRAPHIGFGLLASVVVGFAPLSDAFQGNGSFEGAIGRFLACVAFCVVAAVLLGRVLDSAPPEAATDASETGGGAEPTAPTAQPDARLDPERPQP